MNYCKALGVFVFQPPPADCPFPPYFQLSIMLLPRSCSRTLTIVNNRLVLELARSVLTHHMLPHTNNTICHHCPKLCSAYLLHVLLHNETHGTLQWRSNKENNEELCAARIFALIISIVEHFKGINRCYFWINYWSSDWSPLIWITSCRHLYLTSCSLCSFSVGKRHDSAPDVCFHCGAKKKYLRK